MTFCMFVDCMYYVLRAPRKIGAKPIGLPSLNKVFTYYLLTYLAFNVDLVDFATTLQAVEIYCLFLHSYI